jgi:hypothetical protein
MTDPLPSKDLAERLRKEAQAGWHGDFAAFLTSCADEIDRLQRQNDTCGLQCSATMKSLLAEVEQLRTTLTGISTCSTCEACRGAARLALGQPPGDEK